MTTKITILSNGSVAPNKPIALGHKYENVGDILQFNIPTQYKSYHLYLAFRIKKKKPFLLPVNKNGDSCEFQITSTVTKNAGTYEMVFLATENQIVDDDIDTIRMVFISNTMQGIVTDNFIEDCVLEEEMDPNFQTVYDELLDLKQYFEENVVKVTDEYLDKHLTDAASAAIDAKFKWSWNPDTQTLYIETENIETTPQPVDGVKF